MMYILYTKKLALYSTVFVHFMRSRHGIAIYRIIWYKDYGKPLPSIEETGGCNLMLKSKKKGRSKSMSFDLTINTWAGAQRLSPKPRQFQLLKVMLYDLIAELVKHGLPDEGTYWATPDAESTVGVNRHEFRIQKRAGNGNHPGLVYLRVWLERGTCFAVSLTLPGNNKLAALCAAAVRGALGPHNHFQFTREGKLVRGGDSGTEVQRSAQPAEPATEPATERVEPTMATASAQESTAVQPESRVEPVIPAHTQAGTNAAVDSEPAESEDSDSTVGLTRFFADSSNQVLILAQLAELCIKGNTKEVAFPDWIESLKEQWGSKYKITSVGVRRAIAREGRKIGWFSRRVGFGTTWYSITQVGVKTLSSEQSYHELADRYQQIAGFASNDTATSAANDPVAQLANKHAEFIASERELCELRTELAESGEILRNLRETVSRLDGELRAAKALLRETEADTVTDDDVAVAERKLAELQPSEELYQRVAALLAR